MAKIIDISGKLTNERPQLKLAEGKVYDIDNRKNTILLVNQKVQTVNVNDLTALDEIMRLTLGDEAAKEIDEMNLPFTAYQSIFIAIMAAVSGEEYESMESRFRRAQDQI